MEEGIEGINGNGKNTIKSNVKPWLVWLSGLGTGLRIKGSPVHSPARAHAWLAGQVPVWATFERQPTDVSLPLFLPPFPSLQK